MRARLTRGALGGLGDAEAWDLKLVAGPLWGPDVVRPGASAPTVVAEELPGLQGVKPSFGLASRSWMKWCRPSWFGRGTNLHAPGLGGRLGSVPLREIAWKAPSARSYTLCGSPCPVVLLVPPFLEVCPAAGLGLLLAGVAGWCHGGVEGLRRAGSASAHAMA